jgi:hypothetical protein
MSTDHQAHIKNIFNRESILFLELTEGRKAPLPDLDEVVTDYKTNPEASQKFIDQTIDFIVKKSESLIKSLPKHL